MNTEQKIISNSENETEAVGAALARELHRGRIVLLNGDLGAGKTVFARGFARGLGITEPVSSPTYTIVQEYPLPDGGRLYHLDLYRIAGAAEALAFGVEEFLDDPESLALIEWPERITSLLPDNAVSVMITHLSPECREITVTK